MIYFTDSQAIGIFDRCYRPLCFAASGDEYWGMTVFNRTPSQAESQLIIQLGLQGTCTLIEYRNNYYALFTRHQIALVKGETLAEFQSRMNELHILMDDGNDGYNLPINNLIFSFDASDDGDEDDFVIAVAEKEMLLPFMKKSFFPVTKRVSGQIGDKVLIGGYPMHLQSLLMQIDGNRTVKIAKTGQIVRYEAGRSAMVDYVSDDAPLDGMSGSPVFVARIADRPPGAEKFMTFIDGLVQRGGGGRIYYLPLLRILNKIDEKIHMR